MRTPEYWVDKHPEGGYFLIRLVNGGGREIVCICEAQGCESFIVGVVKNGTTPAMLELLRTHGWEYIYCRKHKGQTRLTVEEIQEMLDERGN
jgi:hypothetical protein